MRRYIDANALREKVLYHADTMNHAGNHEQAKAFNYCLCMIDDMPKYGKWLFSKRLEDVYDLYGVKSWAVRYSCSNCKFSHEFIENHTGQYNYCPNCGAKMDQGEEEQ